MITSTKNPVVKLARRVASGREPGLLLAEGAHLVAEALAAGVEIEHSLVCDHDLAGELRARARQHDDCSAEVLARASSLTTSPGVLAICRIPQWSADDLFRGRHPFVVFAAGVRDPGNLGSLVRTAEAAGASGFVALSGSADPFRDKAVRGSAGSVFRLPCWSGIGADGLQRLTEATGMRLIALDSRDGESLWDADFGPHPHGFVLGSEASGLPDDVRGQCGTLVRITTQPTVESLNVAVAAGVVLFEHRRRIAAT